MFTLPQKLLADCRYFSRHRGVEDVVVLGVGLLGRNSNTLLKHLKNLHDNCHENIYEEYTKRNNKKSVQ